MSDVPLRIVPKTFRDTVADAVSRGWVLERTSQHLRLRHPRRGFVVFSLTPSEYRGLANLKAGIRRLERQE